MKDIRKYPMHSILGFGMVSIGIWLIANNRFFTWPPGFVETVNDDIWGGLFVICGLAHFLWVLDGTHSVRWNTVLLTITSGLMGFLTCYQFLTWTATGHYYSWISNAIITAFVIVLARNSDTIGGGAVE